MSSRFETRIDPVTFEVIRHRLWQINDEQGRTIINVSGSPIASEGNDLNVALTDRDGNIISVGPYILLHVSAITLVIKNAIAMFEDRHIQEGDMFLTNDPWMGAGHQNDVCVVQPVFYGHERVAWTASVIHQVDVGGPYPGSWNPKARDMFDEAPRYKFLRIVRQHEVQPEVLETYLTNSRTPELLELDLRAQIAAGNVTRARLHELFARYGRDTIMDAMADMIGYAQWLFTRKLRALPDGEWSAEDYLDHDGQAERMYVVRCQLRKKHDRLLFDFRGTSPQAPGFINCTYSGAVAGVYGAVFPYLCPDIPWNSGVTRNIDVHVDEGTVHNAKAPAPVGFGVVHACSTTTNVAATALGKLLSCSHKYGSEAMAAWQGASLVYNIFGVTDQGEQFATMLLSSDMQGCGARAFGDGFDVGGKLSAPRSKVANIESIEAKYPLLYLYRRRTQDSGGAGRWRGGVSAEVAFTPHGTSKIEMTVNTLGVAHSCASGLCGGYPGGGSFVMRKQATDLAKRWEEGGLPTDLGQLGGTAEVLAAKCQCVLESGDVFLAVPHGGGGIGDPLDRPVDRVRADVAGGIVSPDAARDLYGVVFDGRVEPDLQATSDLRDYFRRERLDAQAPVGSVGNRTAPSRAVDPGARPYGALRIQSGHAVCEACGSQVGHDIGDAYRALVPRRLALRSLGPMLARKWHGDSPFAEAIQLACPHCGHAVWTEQTLKSEPMLFRDYVLNDVQSPDRPFLAHRREQNQE